MNTGPTNNPMTPINLEAEIAAAHLEKHRKQRRRRNRQHAWRYLSPSRGDLCWASVPFTNGRGAKLRPILVLGVQGDLVIAPLTSHPPRDEFDIEVSIPAGPGFRMPGTVRCSRIGSISSALVHRIVGRLGRGDWKHVVEAVATWARSVVTYDLAEEGFSA